MKYLLKIVGSDNERECIRYATWKASRLSITAARKRFGFDDMRSRAEHVHQARKEVKLIREAVDSMARTQEKAVLHSFGFTDIDSSRTDASDSDSLMSDDSDSEAFPEFDITESELIGLVCASSLNWFEVIDQPEESFATEKYEALLCHFAPKEQVLLRQSYDAYVHVKETLMADEDREAAAWNGEVVSESDSENPDDYLGAKLL